MFDTLAAKANLFQNLLMVHKYFTTSRNGPAASWELISKVLFLYREGGVLVLI